jgi:murein DD-endopeptidase MepM/ murein hydrolase activator NlpD
MSRLRSFATGAAAISVTATLLVSTPPSAALAPVEDAPSATAPTRSAAAAAAAAAESGRRFWVKDKHFYFSRWYAGKHRKMINFGCTRAPYYDPDPRCIKNRGYHHGLDVAMACGTRLYAGFRGRVVRPGSAGALGPAYGAHAFRLRNQRFDKDFVIGHVRRVYVDPGDVVRRRDLVARASDDAAPDGCHLHFEVRPKRGGYTTAVSPHPFIRLHR